MNKRELYHQKSQAQLDEWKAEVDKLKAQAAGSSADAQLEFTKQLKTLENKIEIGKEKLARLADSSDGAWESVKQNMDFAWGAIKSTFSDAANKLRHR
ncbi:MAG: coiled coil domain-containing protein [Reinekea sp.]